MRKKNKKFYVVLFCMLSFSVLLLGMSYSKNSNDKTDTGIIESSNESFRVVFSNDKNLDTKENNKLRINLINKKDSNTKYALYLQEVDNELPNNVYYTINNSEKKSLSNNIIYLDELSKYGTEGDVKAFDIQLISDDNYSFYYSVGEYTFVEEVSYGS